MASCDLSEQFFEPIEIINEEIIYGMQSDFDYHDGLIGACEQVCEETVQTTNCIYNSSSFPSPEYLYSVEDNNYLNVQNTEEVIASDIQDHFNYDSSAVNNSEEIYSCEVCGRRFSMRINLQNHMSVHETEHLHNCNFCGAIFYLKNDLSTHVKIHANYSETKVNEDCNNNPKIVQKMSNSVRKSKRKIKCPYCNSKIDEAKFDNHVCVHNISSCEEQNQDNDYKNQHYCELCDKDFINKTRLSRHMMSHRKKMSCNFCDEKFTSQHDLINHCSIHKKTINGEKIFDCKECGKIFASRSSQQIHARFHTGEKPYACSFCDRAFADGGTLRKHERIHTGEKPYVCLICEKAFNQRVVLRDHIKSHHIGQDPNYMGTKTPYCCKICNNLFSTSDEIHKDIVKHCDDETKKKRQTPTGPRKYKKRTFRKSQMSDENFNSMEEKTDIVKKKRGRKSKLEMQLLTDDWKNNILKNEPQTTHRSDNKYRVFSGGEMNRPRTKNVSRPANDNFRFVPARFPDPKEEFDEISAAVDSIKVKMEVFDRPEIQGNCFERSTRRKIKQEMY